MKAILLIALLLPTAWQVRSIQGTYRNPALGYAVEIPTGLKGITGDHSGPERGFRIELKSGGSIAVFGEPNSLEFKSAADGVRHRLENERCGKPTVTEARIGQLRGAEGTATCEGQTVIVLLALRPGGGPIYWLVLETPTRRKDPDRVVLRRLAGSLRMIRWE